MDTKASIPASQLSLRQVSPLIEVYFEFNHLKQLYRQGWLQRGIPHARCESVAEHTFGVAVLALLLAEAHFPDLDACKVLRMALLHDFGEIYAGDITPAHGIDRSEKVRLERQAVHQVFGKLTRGADYLALWEEYERGASPEAQFVRQIDRLEMVLQASVYEHQELADLSEFFTSVEQALSTPALQSILHELKAMRAEEGGPQGSPQQ
ncbi:MAG: phosphodiesterase [Candidatus Entotheonella factor]|uniref:5'-deoxynucleotidase n=1 Tax=Entotheonella factor TaxID=1429438 RepID=W4LDI4_ENTF1|nr:HD domain-containing protein [Candidatus Entotheonella palauensis]ETW95356.1 MAG: phosphodiesterase [Candidatus Entotheonella factor]